MGMVWRNSDLNNMRSSFNGFVEDLEDGITDALVDAVEYGYSEMKKTVETSGTGYVGKGARATPEGRIDTGLMIDSIDRDLNKSGTTISGEFGWLDRQENYFLYQENGFRNVPPMHALLGAFVPARERLIRRLAQLAKNGK